MNQNLLKKIPRLIGALSLICIASTAWSQPQRPNLIYVFADQWRAQATGYAGDPNLQGKTPNVDRLAKESINLVNTVSTMPVCTPYRASLLTGQYAQTHGLFLNDKPLDPKANTIGKVYKAAGYNTAYVGKWHVDGHGRTEYIPPERRHGFDYWKVLECTHSYNKSMYYDNNDPTRKKWDGYDAFAQTQDVIGYMKEHAQSDRPFALFLSWGPPHDPYKSAPAEFNKLFPEDKIQLRPNVPASMQKKARSDLAGYYGHIAALDECLGNLLKAIDDLGIRENTILVFTSDHGDMLGSQGMEKKQKPYDESCRVPFLIRYPARTGTSGKLIDMPICTPDIMPTLLGLSSLAIPDSVEGTDFSKVLTGEAPPDNEAALIQCIMPFDSWSRNNGGREYRGIRTRQYTYTRGLDGPWLLYDNQADPYQMKNLVQSPEHAAVLKKLDGILTQKLNEIGDEFRPGEEYLKKWGYSTGRGK